MRQGSGPPIFDLQGSINVLDPYNKSQAWAIFVDIIDSVVGAIVEQVCSSTFKFHVLKNTRNLYREMLYFTSKCTKNAFGGPGGGAYSARPDPLAGLKGRRKR